MKMRLAIKVAKASADATLIKLLPWSCVRHHGGTVIAAATVVDQRCDRGIYYISSRKRHGENK